MEPTPAGLSRTQGLSTWIVQVALGLALVVCALFWTTAAMELLHSFDPDRIWIAIGLGWFEILLLSVLLVGRYRRRADSLVAILGLAVAFAMLNFAFVVLVTPII